MLTLYVDEPRWRRHLASVLDAQPRVVPVAKGNGYGFGNARLAGVAEELGADTLAVGTYAEVADVLDPFTGDVLVLTPWRPFETRAAYGPADHPHRRTASRTSRRSSEMGAHGTRPRVVLELVTSMLRHGFTARGLREAADHLARRRGRGVRPAPADGAGIPRRRGAPADDRARGLRHRGPAGLRLAPDRRGDGRASPRRTPTSSSVRGSAPGCGWATGAPSSARATVLDVHEVQRGDVFGYRGRSAPKAGHILVVSGGTAHGIGLEAPTGGASLRDRAARVAKGGLDAAGFVRSPFTVDGKQRLFAEPPHMQASMLFLPLGAHVPAVGDEVAVQVRFTVTAFDETVMVPGS